MRFMTRDYGECLIKKATYSDGGRTALQVRDEDGAPIATLTVNLPDYPLLPNEFFVRTTEENEQIAKDAMTSGLFVDTGRKVRSGWILISVWRFA